MSEQVEIAGRLSRGTVAASSKSEHSALVVAADDGRVLVVRRRGAPAFGDDETSSGSDLASLEGRRVRLPHPAPVVTIRDLIPPVIKDSVW